ncbi:transporter substrate-binding domain-containing protein [Pseudomonas lalucatii]|uniref:Transporter substrate-binding domain-containing protein n=1 Tax=Pseudomonas lalucatii TaxID=1424203 RepID=A0ABS5Q326_9PSED|nr:transporter substrate-binding domain-containing protein [Pseudomonas lalucatii]MBS7662688.1 transporter substrate-binding domain-containing protein [Pseudomonas lalucatii]QVM88624.1 transporter substrate-binding domain-containing protein [Pseudomonas lalucatii]
MKTWLAVILCFCLWLPAGPAPAERYRVGVELQPYLPYFAVQDGQYRGYARELLDAFARDQGHQFVYVPLPVKRLLGDYLAGRLDFKFPDHPNWKPRQKQGHLIHYSRPVAPYRDGVLVLPGHLGRDKARIRLLGTLLGFTPWPYLADIEDGSMTLTQSSSIDSLLRMALSGRVDAIYLNPRVARQALRAAGLPGDALVFDPGLAHVEDHYYLSSRLHPEVIVAFDQFLRRHPQLLRRLRAKYGID